MSDFKVNSIILLFVFVILSFAAKNGTKEIERIVGGETCSVEDYPFIVSIHDIYYAHICGGTLLNHAWVMTAAHCCKDNYIYGEYTVYAGISSQTKLTGQKSVVLENYIHPEYKKMHLKNDIGLMRLETPILQTPVVGYVLYARPDDRGNHPHICNKGQVLGFGKQNIKPIVGRELKLREHNPHLQCVDLYASIDPMECATRAAILFNGQKFCAYANTGIGDACHGDSGGPFVCDKIQYGIVSSGLGCGMRTFAGSYTNVSHYDKFITGIISEGPYSKFNIKFVLVLICICKYI